MWHFIEHFKTITHHRNLVRQHCFKAGLYWQGLTHDLSKYSPTEFLVGAKYYQGDKSPNDAERRDKGYSTAWMHHKGRNKHHLDYWTDYSTDPIKDIVPVRMPTKYVVEMFCDRMAACKTYHKENYTDADPYNYYMKSKDHYMIHPDTAKLLEKMLVMLKDYGEEKTFRYIRRNILRKKRRSVV